jgi:FSR family fosmidomycin resistance protein-like MFS transporter
VNAPPSPGVAGRDAGSTALVVLVAISVSHLFNDTIQSLLMGIYPVLKGTFALDYSQIGLITFTFLITASVLQPVIGTITDRRPFPFSLAIGMGSSLVGLVLLAFAPSYGFVLLAAGLIGLGSAVFHPESSRVARMASGGRFGFAQSVFQVGGNVGNAIGPLLAAAIVVPFGQGSIAWFSLIAFAALIVLWRVGQWYQRIAATPSFKLPPNREHLQHVSRRRIGLALFALVALIFSKFFYLEAFRSYYTFYLIERFGVDVQTAQILLFVQLFAIAVGTLIGGPLGDRFGRKYVIWGSILGVLPLALALPHVGLVATVVLTIPIGLILASAFPAIVVFGQELLPGKTGMVSGLFFGLAFGMGGLGAVLLGELADRTSIEFVFQICAFLPAIGLVTVLLPNIETTRRHAAAQPGEKVSNASL